MYAYNAHKKNEETRMHVSICINVAMHIMHVVYALYVMYVRYAMHVMCVTYVRYAMHVVCSMQSYVSNTCSTCNTCNACKYINIHVVYGLAWPGMAWYGGMHGALW